MPRQAVAQREIFCALQTEVLQAEQREIAAAAADTDDDDEAQELSLGELFEMIEQADAQGVTILVLIDCGPIERRAGRA